MTDLHLIRIINLEQIKLPGAAIECFRSRKAFLNEVIGEGLTAFALSHHPAYGTVPGGSCSRCLQFVLIEEEKQSLLGKETIRQCHLHRFALDSAHGPFRDTAMPQAPFAADSQ